MVKKATLAILTFIYLLVSSGIVLEIHYCMGQRAGVELYGSSDEKCSKCGMTEKKGGCCNNEHQFYKLSDDHKQVNNLLTFEAPAFDLAMPVWAAYTTPAATTQQLGFPSNHSPPLIQQPRLHVLFCVFRI